MGADDQPIRYPSVLRTLGSDYEQQWGDAAHDEIKRVQGSIAKPQHFGDIPAAQDFASVYSAALHVYEATLRGIREDLEAAGAALAAAGREMRDRDVASADGFQALMAQWSTDDGFSSTRNHDEASTDAQVREADAAQVRLEDGEAPAGTDPAGGPADPSTTPDPGMDTGGATPGDG